MEHLPKRISAAVLLLSLLICILPALQTATAEPIMWTLVGVNLGGNTVSGSFTFDADAGTPCFRYSSPCGVYSNVDLSASAGAGLPPEAFVAVCGQDVPSCTGVAPSSTAVLFLVSKSEPAIPGGVLPALQLFFTGAGTYPSVGLSDAGGTIDVSNSLAALGGVDEGVCLTATCTATSFPRGSHSVSGSLVGAASAAAPEPSTLALALLPVAGIVMLRRRRVSATA